MRFTIGTKARNVFVNNNNIFKNQRITQNFNNRSGGLATMLVDFGSSNVQVAVMSNQNDTDVSNISWIRWAFDNSWN